MSALFDDLEKQARLLTLREKATLARILIDGLDPAADSEVERLWIAESERRYAAYRKGELESLSGDEVMSRARNRLT
ncbi:MAG TPA: addiction module protein [Pyrinomonadaceae bacterium]|nr:addiction module protein [Pyrinomonadaceae bacterium]